ncbi:hypothetical protein [Flavobacterium sp. MK4S-17]|uniref:hypothetical protein n=1 Tax=Flavobacterium sp. MK4S-17 TaxID=2543737 RepID=UPI0013584F13|nr:hypothetical protein [Flavobacterium sp. MK4S-17]
MKNLLYFLLLFAAVSTRVSGQNLKNDCEFFKSATYLYSSINLFDEVLNSDEPDAASKLLSQLKTKIDKLKVSHQKVKAGFSKDTDFKQYDSWVQVILKSYEMLKAEVDTWQLGYTLIKSDIADFLKTKY